ncbi:MAG: hypothetical protein LBQ54_13950 [Planctomycetaceae bacterium]|nr:hypothetical protein [Planctomycetaceae bacterium]
MTLHPLASWSLRSIRPPIPLHAVPLTNISDQRERVIASGRQSHQGGSGLPLHAGGILPEHQDADFGFPMSGFGLPIPDFELPRGNLKVWSGGFRFGTGEFVPIITESRTFSAQTEEKDTSPKVKDSRQKRIVSEQWGNN